MEDCVYILYSHKLSRYYVGSTNDLDRRLSEHNRGHSKYTRTGIPWEVVYVKFYDCLSEARKEERRIKKKKSRSYIEYLIKEG